jgi:formamidopyrimidine-DNA glycosylase
VPELPEVETMVRQLRPRLVGRRILRARLSHDDVLCGVTRHRLLRALAGARIRSLHRRAKHAVIGLEGGLRLVVQPGMTGSLLLLRSPLDPVGRRYAVLQAELDRGQILVYRDVRRIGTLLLLDPATWRQYDAALGPEPLRAGFTARHLRAALAPSRQYVKKALMDQRRLAGVGNIYANEALLAAGIDPSRPARSLSADEFVRLHRALRRVLRRAVAANGTTVRDYRTATGRPGGFQFELQGYGRAGAPCRGCGSPLVGTHALDGRITVFCYRCQR